MNMQLDKRTDDEEPRWLPLFAIMVLALVVGFGGAIANIGLAAIHKVRGWA